MWQPVGGRDRNLAVAGVVALGGTTLLLAVFAASSGSVRPVSDSTAAPARGVPVPDEGLGTPSPPTATPSMPWRSPGTGWTAPAWVGAAIEIVVLAGLIVAGFLLLRALIRAALRVLREVELPEPEVNDAANWRRVAREELAQAVSSGFGRIESGTPADAIVACWLALEQAAAAAGVARVPSETPAELTVRVLDACWVSREALERLADLYREARFSEHGLPESARAEARQALDLLRRELAPVDLP